jgi:hypothetical protein
MENSLSQKTRLKGEKLLKCSGTFKGLVLGGRPGDLDRKVAPIISQMSFRFAIDFVSAVLGPCVTEEAERTDSVT